ncbi:MAG: GDSL-type esterase/lipase family protein [Oscillospiraceae bacterium]|nr:GDSL-type esterase/lipase family protein [Oscillospiraceae bacterium]
MSTTAKAALLLAALFALIFYLSGGIKVHHSKAKNAEEITSSVAVLAAMEAEEPPDFEAIAAQQAAEELAAQREALIARKGIQVDDLEAEQDKIVATDPSTITAADLQRLYSSANAVVVGDSIAEGCSAYGWLDESMVFSKIGVSVSTADEQISGAIAAKPSIMFLCFGLNDIASYGNNVSKFIEVYTAAIEDIQAQLPDTILYVNALFPASASTTASKSYYQYLDQYNAALEEMCDSMDGTVFYVNSGFIFQRLPELYEADGMHAKSKFYALWLTYFADIAGFSNDTDNTETD